MGKDVYQIANQYAGERAPYILGVIKKESVENLQIDEQKLKILKRGIFSSVFSLDLDYLNKTTGEKGTQKVLIKYFLGGKGNNLSTQFKDFAQSGVDTSNFLGKNEDFPSLYFFDRHNLGSFLILQHLGNRTLHEETQSMETFEMRNAIQNVFQYLSRFQVNATKNLGDWIENGKMNQTTFYSIFGRRKSAERIVDYIRQVKGKDRVIDLDKGLVEKIISSTEPIQATYRITPDNFRVTHGDPIFKNIILTDKNRCGFIDPELTLGEPIIDLAALLATPNLNLYPSDWNQLAGVFLVTDENIEKENGTCLSAVREKIAPYLEEKGVSFSGKKEYRDSLLDLYKGIFFRSARITAKVKNLNRKHPDLYDQMARDDPGIETTIKDMRRNMSLSLGEIINHPENFKFLSRGEGSDLEKLSSLQKVMIEEGVLDYPEKYPQKNGSDGSLEEKEIII